jgi:DNA gyrase subunit B
MTESQTPIAPTNTYDSSKITVLRGLEAVRKRPACTSATCTTAPACTTWCSKSSTTRRRGAGRSLRRLVVTLHNDGSCSVSDNGRGIPVDIHKEEGVSAPK